MATPADQRILDLLDKWLGSLELHLKYTALDEGSYRQIQPWVPHQRPTRWIIDLAIQKTRALRDLVQERADRGDAGFSEGLEQMAFLANLVGIEHIERFIPLAGPGGSAAEAPKTPPSVRGLSAVAASEGLTGTLEMPKFPEAMLRGPPEVATRNVARTERKRTNRSQGRSKAAKLPDEAVAGGSPQDGTHVEAHAQAQAQAQAQVIADAARLMHWGRNWHELAELIARMADRPPLAEVRQILQENKAAIDEKAGRT